MKRESILSMILFSLLVITAHAEKYRQNDESKSLIDCDVCVYSATPSGILTAIAVKEEGLSVVIVEPSKWVGGMLGAGIKPIQDCPNFEAVGGRTRELMKILGTGKPDNDISATELRKLINTMSPRKIRSDFLEILNQHGIQVIYDHRIRSCQKKRGRITETLYDYAPFDNTGCPVAKPERAFDLEVKAKIYIDASYDGELMARSGVSFRIGRESSCDFSENNAGTCEPTNLTQIDPFVEERNSKSGLLPHIQDYFDGTTGKGDQYIQAYNFRFYVTSDPQYKVELDPPQNYDHKDYELVGRYIEYLKENTKDENSLYEKLSWIFPGWRNSGDYNYQRQSLFTMAPVGVSHLYANGDYATKSRIWKYHQNYLAGLHYFLITDSRVPEKFREQTASLGLDIRQHPETHGWPHQLYIREARRLIGRYTITSDDVYNKTDIDDPIALAQYGIDVYPSRRIWLKKDGKVFVGLEGEMFVGGAKGPTNTPYPIPYRSITPKEYECSNLLVPVCFSATHLGYASARMEPVFMMCGESAGIAAVHAIQENVSVQNINMDKYEKKLISLKQKLLW